MQKSNLHGNSFKGTAERFYILNVRREMIFDDRIPMMKREFDSEDRSNQVQADLDSLTLSSFMANREIFSDEKGLSEVINHINTIHLQVPEVFQSDAGKLRFIFHAVFACTCAHTSLKISITLTQSSEKWQVS